MATKPSQPALYEKFRNRPGPSTPALMKTDVPPLGAAIEPTGSWLRPGRSVRMPMGYILLAIGLAISLAAMAFSIGHSRGYKLAQTELENQFLQSATGTIADPLGSADLLNETRSSGPASTASKASNQTESYQARPSSAWGPVVPKADPRKEGLNYFVLVETSEDGARQLAEFCRSHGLETYVVSGKNDRRRVVVFPGFQAADRSSPSVKALESQIYSVGEKWRTKNKGGTNLRDAYPSLYTG